MPELPYADAQTLGQVVDRLRSGLMSDLEALDFAADLVRSGRVNASSQDVFNLLANRLKQIKLREESPDAGE